jgi:hypothetical protein
MILLSMLLPRKKVERREPIVEHHQPAPATQELVTSELHSAQQDSSHDFAANNFAKTHFSHSCRG